MLVWQDIPSAQAGRNYAPLKDGEAISPELAAQFEGELKSIIGQHDSVTSIVIWVLFNEAWGQFDTARLTKVVKDTDPTRLVNSVSGWFDRKVGDMIDMHLYPGPGSPIPEPNRAAVLGEFGGKRVPLAGHLWASKDGKPGDLKEFLDFYLLLWKDVEALKEEPGLSAAIYTQTTDVEAEDNGVITYDRRVVKLPAEIVADVHTKWKFPPGPKHVTLSPMAESKPIEWKVATKQPAEDWSTPLFNDASWAKSSSGFGHGYSRIGIIRTDWTTPEIWMRRTFDAARAAQKPQLKVLNEGGNAEVFLNGKLVQTITKSNPRSYYVELKPDAAALIKPGKNVLAVHAKSSGSEYYIDVGLVDEVK